LSFSVVIPTYRRCETLFAVLDGLAGQTDAPPFEVVVVDDGSGDETPGRLAAHRAPYPFRFFSQPNAGPAGARNLGVREAAGRVVLFLGDDTVPEPGLLAAHAAAHAEKLVNAIGGSDPLVALEAVKLAGRLRLPTAVGALTQALGHEETALRAAAVQALSDLSVPGALQGLEKALDDPDREVRLATVRILMMKKHRGALPKVTAAIQGKSVRVADLTEKMAFFEAYGSLVGAEGVPSLDAMLNSGGFLKRREDPELRACAALALGKIGTDAARASLERATDAKDALVRNAVSKALRGLTGPGAA